MLASKVLKLKLLEPSSIWLGYLDSNQGMLASKASALPLGDNPTNMVRKERLELSHLAAPEPKSGASTNSATSAFCYLLREQFITQTKVEIFVVRRRIGESF